MVSGGMMAAAIHTDVARLQAHHEHSPPRSGRFGVLA
jgi:hypothetical protein